MTQYTINLTTPQDLALSSVVADQHEWIMNFVSNRCRIATDEIVKLTVEKCLETGVQLPGSKDAIILLAFEKGWVKPSVELQAEYDVNRQDL